MCVMLSKPLELKDYQDIPVGLEAAVEAHARITGLGYLSYLPHEHRLWEYGSAAQLFSTLPGSGKRALEVGCGFSPLSYALRLLDPEVVLAETELTEALVKQRNILNRCIKMPEACVLHDATTPLPDDQKFDFISCMSVIEHIPPDLQGKVVDNLLAALKPEGAMIITTDYFRNPTLRHENDHGRLTKYGPENIEAYLDLFGARKPQKFETAWTGRFVFDYNFYRVVILGEPNA